MNKTTNYQLNQWAKSDQVKMEDFNADNAKIDAAIKAVDRRVDGRATQAALNALSQTVAGKGNCRIVTGTYTGTGTYGENYPNSLDFAGTLGKPPELIIIRAGGGSGLIILRGMASTFYTLDTSVSSGGHVTISWTETGLSWFNKTSAPIQHNTEGSTYRYVAFG